MDNKGIENKPLMFIYEDNKWIPIPTKYEWDIDIKLKPKTFSRKNNLMTIINSGTIIANLISLPPNELIGRAVLWRRGIEKSYCIATQDKKEAHFEFHSEHPNDKNFINNPPIGSTIIIEGKIREPSEEKEILPGLLIASPDTSDYGFKIILIKEDPVKYGIRFVTPNIKITQVENKTLGLSPIKIHAFYYICRIRLTTKPVSDNEIQYL